MSTYTRFEDLPIRQQARGLYKEIIVITKRPAPNHAYRFCSQIKAAAGSVMDNLAEGLERASKPEFLNHLSYAKGPAGDVRSQLYRALDESFAGEDEQIACNNRYTVSTSDTANLIRDLNHCDVRGLKFAGRNEKSTTARSGFTKTPRRSHGNQKLKITNQKSQ